MKTINTSATLAFAKGVLNRTYAFGSEEISKALGIPIQEFGKVPPLPFSEAEINRALELGQYLIFQPERVGGEPFTMKFIHKLRANKLGDDKLLYDIDWYKDEPFFTEDVPNAGWRLVSQEVIPDSTDKNYLAQTQILSDYLVKNVYAGEELPEIYHAAVLEFESCKAELGKLLGSDWKKAAEELARLQVNQLFREKPVEALLGFAVNYTTNHEYLLDDKYTWTNQRSSRGNLVFIGELDSAGACVYSDGSGDSRSGLGVRFSRGVVPGLVS